MQFGLSDSTIEKINSTVYSFGKIEKIILFGSRAKGTSKLGSDIDLAVFGNIDLRDHNLLANKLDDLMLPYKIDLVIYENIKNADLVEHISRVGKLFFSR